MGYVAPYQQTLNAYPETDQTIYGHYARAYAWHKAGYPDRADAEANALVKADPEDPYFLEIKGQILLEAGRPKEALAPLRLQGAIEGLVRLTSFQASVTVPTLRSQWHQGSDSIPDDVIAQMMQRMNVGWWNGPLRLAGFSDVCEANLKRVLDRLAKFTKQEFPVTRMRGDAQPGPTTYPLQMVNWYGGRGGHIGYSPVMPADPKLVQEQFERTRRRYQQFGLDYSGTFYLDGRAATNVNLILYSKDDEDQKQRVRQLFQALIKDAREQGYGEYRTHLSYMDDVAASYDYNHNALLKLNERVKDALDPNGIIAPGRNGIWPKAYRAHRGVL